MSNEDMKAKKKNRANDLAARFKGLMPRMTDDQMLEVRDMLMIVPEAMMTEYTLNGVGTSRAWEKLKGYINEREDFSIASVRAVIFGGDTTAGKTAEELAEYRVLGRAIEEQWAHIDQVLDELAKNDADLFFRAKAAALAHSDMPEWARKKYAETDATLHKHRFLRGEMFKRLESGDVPAEAPQQAAI